MALKALHPLGDCWNFVLHRSTLLNVAVQWSAINLLIMNKIKWCSGTHNAGVGGSSPPVATIKSIT